MSYQTFLVLFFIVGFIHEMFRDFGKACNKHEHSSEIVGYMFGCLVWNGVKYGTIALCLVKGGFFSK